MELLGKLDKNELIELIKQYDNYIKEANEANFYLTGWHPVCIEEFYNWEFNSYGGDVFVNKN